MEVVKFVVVTVGGAQTITVTATLSTYTSGVQLPLTRTQNVFVEAGYPVTVAAVSPLSGLLVLPGVPVYHW
jgi:hypothetical protein